MRVRALIGLLLLAILSLGGKCVIFIRTTPSPAFVLSPGQIVHASGLHIKFLIVIADGRCPVAAHCESAGDAVVAMQLNSGRNSTQVELQLVDAARRTAVFDGYAVELTSLDPQPVAGQTIDPVSYRATIDVRRQ